MASDALSLVPAYVLVSKRQSCQNWTHVRTLLVSRFVSLVVGESNTDQ